MSPERRKQLEAAVREEKRATETLYREQLQLSPAEQRKSGIALFPLMVDGQEDNGSRTTVHFRTSFPINETYFRRGCRIRCVQGEWQAAGRLTELNATSGSFSLADESVPRLSEHPVTLLFEPDDRTMDCMELGVRLAGEHPQLLLLGNALEKGQTAAPASLSEALKQALNARQQIAAAACLSDQPVVMIQGPPGTGKTRTLAATIAWLVRQGKQVIVSAPSNTAVDNLCHALLDRNVAFMRLGNEEKMSARVAAFTIDGYLENGESKHLFAHLHQSLRKAAAAAEKFYRNPSQEDLQERAAARKERNQLRLEIRQLLRSEEQRLIQTVPVLAGTPVGLFNALPKTFSTDIAVIDEAGQCPEPLIWLTASFAKRLIVCGDQQQLPPVVLSRKAQELGLGRSVLEQQTALPMIVLQEQYRMAEPIMNSINAPFYNGQLVAHLSVPENGEIRFIDMAGYGEGEQQDPVSGSTFNTTEAQAVRRLTELFDADPATTVVLSPYNAQLELLRKQLPAFRISTIDAMQGQEAETVIISLTRSNDRHEIGFLKDYRRTNVAISRAKKRCLLIGDSATIGSDPFYNALLEYVEHRGTYQSIWEFEA